MDHWDAARSAKWYVIAALAALVAWFGLHAVTIIVAYRLADVGTPSIVAATTALMPVVAELYWVTRVTETSGTFLNWYVAALTATVALSAVALLGLRAMVRRTGWKRS